MYEICAERCHADTPNILRSAEAMLQALTAEAAEGKKFSLQSKEGEGPGQDQAAWQALFAGAA